MVNEPRRIIGIASIINFNDNGIFQNLHSAAYIYTSHHWTGVRHGRAAPARESIRTSGAGTGELERGAGTGERHRHGGVAPAPESGAGTGEWRQHGRMGELEGAGMGEWRRPRHGGVAPARESGAGTGEWRRHKTWMAAAAFA